MIHLSQARTNLPTFQYNRFMEKEAFAQKLLVPELDESSKASQNCEHFLQQLMPLLEHIRRNSPKTYQQAISQFRQHWESKIHTANLKDTLEYLLTYLKQNFGMQFYLEEDEDSFYLESVECPLVHALYRKGNCGEIERKTLCFHCSHYHYLKFFNLHAAESRLSLHPNGCQYIIEKNEDEQVNPLFY